MYVQVEAQVQVHIFLAIYISAHATANIFTWVTYKQVWGGRKQQECFASVFV